MEKETKKLTLVEWCDQQVAEGHELTIHWEGGGDSGWAHFEIDSEEQSNEYIEELVNYMYDELDYGSWAGEFFATGQATYNTKTKCFEGVDNYSEDTTMNWDTEIPVKIPKSLWFDSVTILIQDEEANVEVSFNIRNGYLSDEHHTVEKELEEYLHDKVDDEISEFSESHNFRNIWEQKVINRSEFTEEGDTLVYIIEDLSMGTSSEEDKDIVLDVSVIDEHLKNDTEDEEE